MDKQCINNRCNINIYLKNICYLINQSHGEINIEYCHQQLDKFNADKSTNKWTEIHLDHEMQDRWNKLMERKNDILEISREKSSTIRELEEKIKNYEEIISKKNISTNDKECQNDGIKKEEKASFCDIINDENNQKKESIHSIKYKFKKENDNKQPIEIKVQLSLNDTNNNNIQSCLIKPRKRKRKKQTFKENIKNKKRKCINIVNKKKCENKNNDDNYSIITSSKNTTTNTMETFSTRNLTRMEWNLYRDAFQTFIKSYSQISINNNNDKKNQEKESILYQGWTHVSDIAKDFHEWNTLGGNLTKKTIGCLLKALKQKKTDEYRWLQSVQNMWNITKNK